MMRESWEGGRFNCVSKRRFPFLFRERIVNYMNLFVCIVFMFVLSESTNFVVYM